MTEEVQRIKIVQKEGEDVNFERRKRVYFQGLMIQYLPEIRLNLRGGMLWKKDNWRGVLEHEAVQLAEVVAIGEMLNLPDDDIKRLARAVLVHDWDKRQDIMPKDFDGKRKTEAKEFYQKVAPDKELIAATETGFSKRILSGKANFLQRLMFYIDDITAESDIVPLEERINVVRDGRGRKLDEDPEWNRKLGGKYWDVELEVGKRIEEEIYEMLRKREFEIESQKDVPRFIRKQINTNIRRVNL